MWMLAIEMHEMSPATHHFVEINLFRLVHGKNNKMKNICLYVLGSMVKSDANIIIVLFG